MDVQAAEHPSPLHLYLHPPLMKTQMKMKIPALSMRARLNRNWEQAEAACCA